MNKGKMNTALVLKIVVPAVVVVLVGGVFFLKKSQNPVSPATDPAATSSAANEASIVPIVSKSPSAGVESSDLLITTPIDFDALRSSGLPVIIDFGADSCIPCKEMAPVLVELNKSLKGKAIIRFVDVWKYRDLAEGVPLQVIPTQVFFDSAGKPFNPPESLQIEFIMYSLKDTDEHVFTTHEGGLDKPQMLAILAAMGMK
jgi:thioredoxin 1